MVSLGFVGTGTLAESVIRGLQATDARACRFHLSPRSEERSRALAAAYANTVREESNAAVVERSDIVMFGVLPKQIGTLGDLPFRPDQIVVSFLAGVPLARVRAAVGPAARVVRMIPLPCIEFGRGPILMTPAEPTIERLFGPVGDLVVPAAESDLDTISIASGLMSAHFQLQNTVVDWLEGRGIAHDQAARFTRSLFIGLGELAREDERRHGVLPPAHYETKGGLNETARAHLNHMGWFEEMTRVLAVVDEHRRTLAT